MQITLLVPRLVFVKTGTHKIHAHDEEVSPLRTMCGLAITYEDTTLPERTLPSETVCKSCYASLRTYTGRLGSIPKVRIEQA